MTDRPVLNLVPITFAEARRFIAEHHRHNPPSLSWKFGVALEEGGLVVGVGVAGRPVSRVLDDGMTVEITRVCLSRQIRNGNSKLYGALKRAAWALGYKRVVSYTLASESGSSLKAAGFKRSVEVKGRSWDCVSRPRIDSYTIQDRFRWDAITPEC